jgi:hypothetical protein
MSIPAWQYKLEEVEFYLKDNPKLIVDWLLNHPNAKEIPTEIRKARLSKYGYQEPKPEPEVKTFTTEERQASKTRAKRNRKDAE